MADRHWIVKDSAEALKQFSADAGFIARWDQTAPERCGRRNTSRPEESDEIRALLDR